MNEIRLLTAGEIECRVGQCGKSQKGVGWCSLLLYKDARCDMRILDEVFGMFGWKKSYTTINGGLFCTISVKNPDTNEWVDKQDIGTESNTEAKKGEASDAMKRACFNLGIGRELYTAPKIFITLNTGELVEKNGRQTLSPKCSFSVAEIDYDDNRNIKHLVIVDNNGVIRYKMGEAVQQPMQANNSDIDDQLNGYALPAIGQAQTREELRRIWNDFPALQDDQRFVSALNNRQNEINKVA